MLLNSLILLLLSNSTTSRRDKSIQYSRATITILLISAFVAYENFSFLFLAKGIGIFGGLFHTTATANFFHIFMILIVCVIHLLTSFYSPANFFHTFMILIVCVIHLLTSFYSRKLWFKAYSSLNRLIFNVYLPTSDSFHIFRFLTTLNDELKSFSADSLITKKKTIVKKVDIQISNIVISSSLSLSISSLLSLSISIITLITTLFIFIPEELLSFANILALILFNL